MIEYAKLSIITDILDDGPRQERKKNSKYLEYFKVIIINFFLCLKC